MPIHSNTALHDTPQRWSLRLVFLMLWSAVVVTVLSGCAGPGARTPETTDTYLERAQTQTDGQVRVTASVPSASESREIFDSQLYRGNVQPIFLEVENLSSSPLRFLPVGTERLYYTPNEAAIRTRASERSTTALQFHNATIGNITIPPGESRTGFIFTELDEGSKTFNVDMMSGTNTPHFFTFFIEVPGLRIDHKNVDWDNVYPQKQWRDLKSSTAMIEALEGYNCCTSEKSGTENGDPLNIVVIGEFDEVYYAFLRAGWDETETVNTNSLARMAGSFLKGGNYRYSPVSGLYVFGRTQDIAFQRTRTSINERNHLRLWLTPLRYHGEPVFIGQISRDIGVRFSKRTIVTHEIDPDVDETREYLLENLAYSQALAAFAYVGGVGEATIDAPRENLTESPYFTDGRRVVLWVTKDLTSIDDINVVNWRGGAVR
jgi:hypothetical protein